MREHKKNQGLIHTLGGRKEYNNYYKNEHMDKIKERAKLYKEQHKDEIKQYREQHKDQISEQTKTYKEQNKDIFAQKYDCGCVDTIVVIIKHDICKQ